MDHRKSDRWLHARLRKVPLPPGLLAQIREIARADDEQLDALIGQVQIPTNLCDNLRQTVENESVDQRIAEVSVPEGLTDGWKQIPEEENIDQKIAANVDPSQEMMARWRYIPQADLLERDAAVSDSSIARRRSSRTRRGRQQSLPMWRLATALSLLLMLGAGYLLVKNGLNPQIPVATSPTSEEEPIATFLASDQPFVTFNSSEQEGVKKNQQSQKKQNLTPSKNWATLGLIPDLQETKESQFDTTAGLSSDSLESLRKLLENEGFRRRSTLASPHRDSDGLPSLFSAPSLKAGGMEAPIVRGFDRSFLLKYGVNPIVVPGVSRQLATCRVPLSTSRASFEEAVHAVKRKHLPSPDTIREEEFLAAMDYHFPLPTPGDLAIRTAAGPSWFVGPRSLGAKLIQVGVVAGLSTAEDENGIVAADTVLQVRFHPKSVLAYRLIGYAPRAAGLMPADQPLTLHGGEAAVALFEVWLRPGGGNQVAVAEVQWRDPKTGVQRQRSQQISRLQFANSFAEMAPSLQMAAIAAETAEVLGKSPFVADRSQSLKSILEQIDEVNPQTARNESFQRLAELVRQAEKVRHTSQSRDRKK